MPLVPTYQESITYEVIPTLTFNVLGGVSWQIIVVLNILLILILSPSTQGSIYNTIDSLSHALVQDGIPVHLNLIPCIAVYPV